MADSLALVLDGIAMSSKTPSSLKKALSYRAVEILLVERPVVDDYKCISDLEKVAHILKEKFNIQSIKEGIAWLRPCEPALANRLRALTRSRNTAAHPDTGLPDAISKLSVKDIHISKGIEKEELKLIGSWQNCEDQHVVVHNTHLGLLAQFDGKPSYDEVHVQGEGIMFKDWKVESMAGDKVVWKQLQGDLEFQSGELKHKDELRHVTWTRLKDGVNEVFDEPGNRGS